jgi:hypothetical protein
MTRSLRIARPLAVLSLLGIVLLLHVANGRAAGPAASPPASPTGAVIDVSTVAELQAALMVITSNTTIVLAPGTYQLSRGLSINGTVSNIAVRGTAGGRDAVVLTGHGLSVGGDVQGALIADLTIRDARQYAIAFGAGIRSPRVSNVRLVDAGTSFITSAGGDDGILEHSVVERTRPAADTTAGGIEIQGGANWIIRHNLFRNIVSATHGVAGPAILVRHASRGTMTEGNTFLNCARAIVYGVEDDSAGDITHTGGVIRNNVVHRSSTQPGAAGISVAGSPGTRVVNNTVFLSGTSSTPIEYRFAGTTDVLLANNLLDGFIWARDGATGTERNNLSGVTASAFVNASTGDLHLVSSAAMAIDHGVALADVVTDVDGDARPSGAGVDIGADEYIDYVAPSVAVTAPAAVARAGAGRTATAAAVPVVVNAAAVRSCPCSIWNGTTTPKRIETSDTNAVELGVRFRADVNGTIRAVRFYRGAGSGGPYIANLWTNGGTRLATATVAGGTAAGWQQATFRSPVAVTAGTTYVASYHASAGRYAVDDRYFATAGVDNAPLHALADVAGRPNGLYLYGASAFPTKTFQSAHYWVDIVFAPAGGDTTAPAVSMTAPAAGSTVSGTAVTVTAIATDAVGVAGVQFKLDGVNLLAEETEVPYSIVWNTTTAANGTHTLTAVARDANGNATTSAAITVTVNNAVAPAPPPTAVIFHASADHATGVESYLLEVFANGADPKSASPVASSSLGKPAPDAAGDVTANRASFFSSLRAGTYVVTVSAIGRGTQARSAPVTMTR